MGSHKTSFVSVQQRDRHFFLMKLPAAIVVNISYAAVRGTSDEDGAVQRILNQRRISKLRDFTLEVATYPSSIILNWVNKTNPLRKANGQLSFQVEPRSAQIIDGQHRVAGIRAAIEVDPSVGDLEIPVSLYDRLDTQACADIFLSINTEQKPVPKSLVFDLYGISSSHLVDPAVERARDIATALHEESSSPYYGMIKFPGARRSKGGIALSTAVTALKPLIEAKGVFEQVGIKDLADQTQVILNYFQALQSKYGVHWDSLDNAFMYASGFQGALQFLRTKLADYCNLKRSFTVDTISSVIHLGDGNLIRQSEVKGLGGSIAAEKIVESLVEVFRPHLPDDHSIAI